MNQDSVSDVLPDECAANVVAYLNSLLAIDRAAVMALIGGSRVPCNGALAGHPRVQVGGEGDHADVGPLGLLNGMFRTITHNGQPGWGRIMAVYSTEMDFLDHFELVPQDEGLPSCK